MTTEQSDAISQLLQAQVDAEATLRESALAMYRHLAPRMAQKHPAAVDRLMEFCRAESRRGTFALPKGATDEMVAQVSTYYAATAALYAACREAAYEIFVGAKTWRDMRHAG